MINNSMPSTDTALSATFAAFVSFYMPALFAYAGGEWFRIRLVVLVAMARVYYHCHYLSDTFVGAIIGTAVAYVLKQFDLANYASTIAH